MGSEFVYLQWIHKRFLLLSDHIVILNDIGLMGQVAPKNENIIRERKVSDAFETVYLDWLKKKTPNNTSRSQELADIVYPLLKSRDVIVCNITRDIPPILESPHELFFLSYIANGPQKALLESVGLFANVHEDTDLTTLPCYQQAKRALVLWKEIFSRLFPKEFVNIQTESYFGTDMVILEGYFIKGWIRCVTGESLRLPNLIKEDNNSYFEESKERNSGSIGGVSFLQQQWRVDYFVTHMIERFRNTIAWGHLNEVIVDLLQDYFNSKMQKGSVAHPQTKDGTRGDRGSLINLPYLPRILRYGNLGRRKKTTNIKLNEQIIGRNGDYEMQKYATFLTAASLNMNNINNKVYPNLEDIASMQLIIDTIDGEILNLTEEGDEKEEEEDEKTLEHLTDLKLLIETPTKSTNPEDICFGWWSNIFRFDTNTMKDIVFYSTCLSIEQWYNEFYNVIAPENIHNPWRFSLGIERLIKISQQLNNNNNHDKDIKYQDYMNYTNFFRTVQNSQITQWTNTKNLIKMKIHALLDDAVLEQWGTTWEDWPEIYAPVTTLRKFVHTISVNLPLRVRTLDNNVSFYASTLAEFNSSSQPSQEKM
jgi:hypothetical protein